MAQLPTLRDVLRRDRDAAERLSDMLECGDPMQCCDCPMCVALPHDVFDLDPDWGDVCIQRTHTTAVDEFGDACEALVDEVLDARAFWAAQDALERGDMDLDAARDGEW